MPRIHLLDKQPQSDEILSNPFAGITRIQFGAFHSDTCWKQAVLNNRFEACTVTTLSSYTHTSK